MTLHPRLTTLALFLLIVSAAHAQPGTGRGPQTAITGRVVDAESGDGLRVATVALWNARDSSLATGVLSDNDGSFELSGVRPGRYYLKVTYIGYAPSFVDVTLTAAKPRVELGTIRLRATGVEGQEVVVSGRREAMTIEIDRTVYKAAEMPVAAGGSATDVLRSIPAIEVDIDGNVSLRGNQNVAILLNGRPMVLTGEALASFLEGLPANSVERIEVIPNPSAKYDPDGMSGIINIVLKQENSLGFSGGVNGSVGTNDQYNAGANLAYGEGPWNIFANYGLRAMKREIEGNRYQINRLMEPVRILDQESDMTWANLSHTLNGSIDYAFDRTNTLSLSAMFSLRGGDADDRSVYNTLDASGNLLSRYERVGTGENEDVGTDYRLAYKWAPEPARHELSAELRYASERDDDVTETVQRDLAVSGAPIDSSAFRQRVDQDDHNSELTVQVDYTRPIGDDMRVEAGYKGELENIGSDYRPSTFNASAGEFQPTPAEENLFDYDRTIHAVYANVGQNFGIVSAQVGLRAEQAETVFEQRVTGESYDNDYFSLFPSAFVTVKPSDALQFKASYSRRINRPSTWVLNPRQHSNDPTFRQIGNPYLKPEYIHAIEVGATHFTELTSLTITPFFRRTVDAITRDGEIDSNGVTTTTHVNQNTNDEYGADVIGSIRLGDRFSMFASFSAYQISSDASNIESGLSADGFTWSARANATVQIVSGLDLQASWFYRGPSPILNGESSSHSMSDASLQYRFLDNRARVGLRVRDIFGTAGFSMWRDDPSAYFEFSRKPNARTFALTFSYTFGSQDRNRRQRQGGEEQPDRGDMEGW